MRNTVLIFYLLLLVKVAVAQNERPNQDRSFYWTRYTTDIKFNEQWSLANEIDNRRTISPHRQRQVLFRTTLHRQLGNTLVLGVGGAYTRERDTETGLWEREWRPHQQLEADHAILELQASHRFRLEEQFIRRAGDESLEDHYSFRFRLRYRFQLGYDIFGESRQVGHLGLLARNELVVQSDTESRLLDQLRLSGGLIYQPFKPVAFELQYVWQRRQFDPGEFKYWNIYRLTLLHYISF